MKKAIFFLFLAAFGVTGTAQSADTKPYPLQTCIVSDEELEPSRKPISIVYQGQEVRFCCRECKADFQNNPEKFLKKIPAPDQEAPAS